MLPVFGRGHVRDSAEVGGESVRPLEPAYVGDLLDRTICSLKKHLNEEVCEEKEESQACNDHRRNKCKEYEESITLSVR